MPPGHNSGLIGRSRTTYRCPYSVREDPDSVGEGPDSVRREPDSVCAGAQPRPGGPDSARGDPTST